MKTRKNLAKNHESILGFEAKRMAVPGIAFLLMLAALGLASCKPGADKNRQAKESAPEKTAQSSQPKKSFVVTVYKSPSCGCCTEWEDHLRMNGFQVISHKKDDMIAIKKKHGITRKLSSCHTAIVDGYVIEGHVPAKDIRRLLATRPKIAGLTAPGMPQKSPGMQPHGLPPKDYQVISFTKDGKTQVYASY